MLRIIVLHETMSCIFHLYIMMVWIPPSINLFLIAVHGQPWCVFRIIVLHETMSQSLKADVETSKTVSNNRNASTSGVQSPISGHSSENREETSMAWSTMSKKISQWESFTGMVSQRFMRKNLLIKLENTCKSAIPTWTYRTKRLN